MHIKELLPGEFPEQLREIPQIPKKLYVRGNTHFEEQLFLSVVGSRKHTPYGKEVCEKLISDLSGYPITIVSGLALGIDTIAHKAALSANLTTVAIPGSGLSDEVLYPASNKKLAGDILDAGGMLISEYEPTFKATPWSFPKRNRLMAGISHAVLVIEATHKSGTLITSKLATDYNRDVLAVPGSIFSAQSEGPHMLIKLGATPVTEAADILQALGLEERAELPALNNLSDIEQKVVALLAYPRSRDEIIRELHMNASDANVILATMELKEIITERMGQLHIHKR